MMYSLLENSIENARVTNESLADSLEHYLSDALGLSSKSRSGLNVAVKRLRNGSFNARQIMLRLLRMTKQGDIPESDVDGILARAGASVDKTSRKDLGDFTWDMFHRGSIGQGLDIDLVDLAGNPFSDAAEFLLRKYLKMKALGKSDEFRRELEDSIGSDAAEVVMQQIEQLITSGSEYDVNEGRRKIKITRRKLRNLVIEQLSPGQVHSSIMDQIGSIAIPKGLSSELENTLGEIKGVLYLLNNNAFFDLEDVLDKIEKIERRVGELDKRIGQEEVTLGRERP